MDLVLSKAYLITIAIENQNLYLIAVTLGFCEKLI